MTAGTAEPHADAFRQLVASYDAALWRIAWIYAGSSGEQEDLHQEILLQLWRSLPSFRGEASAGTWLYRVALNTALSWRRGASRRSRVEVGDVAEEYHPVSAGGPRAEAAILREFLSGLNEVDRSVMLLYLDGLSHDQIGDVTGATRGAIAVRLHRLRTAFVERYLED